MKQKTQSSGKKEERKFKLCGKEVKHIEHVLNKCEKSGKQRKKQLPAIKRRKKND